MTNEEVARQLSNNNYLTEDDKELCPSEDTKIRINSYWAAVKMAGWKDKQVEDIKDEIKVDAKKELAWEIHKKIANGATIAELDNYVCGICDF